MAPNPRRELAELREILEALADRVREIDDAQHMEEEDDPIEDAEDTSSSDTMDVTEERRNGNPLIDADSAPPADTMLQAALRVPATFGPARSQYHQSEIEEASDEAESGRAFFTRGEVMLSSVRQRRSEGPEILAALQAARVARRDTPARQPPLPTAPPPVHLVPPPPPSVPPPPPPGHPTAEQVAREEQLVRSQDVRTATPSQRVEGGNSPPHTVTWLNRQIEADALERRSQGSQSQRATYAHSLYPEPAWTSWEEGNRGEHTNGVQSHRHSPEEWSQLKERESIDRFQYNLEKGLKEMRPKAFLGPGEKETLGTLSGPPLPRRTPDEVSDDALTFLDEAESYQMLMVSKCPPKVTPADKWIIGQLTNQFGGLAKDWLVKQPRDQTLPQFFSCFIAEYVSPTYRAALQAKLETLTLKGCEDSLGTYLERHEAVVQALRRVTVAANAPMEDTLRSALRRGLEDYADITSRLVQIHGREAGEDPFEMLTYSDILRALQDYRRLRERTIRKGRRAGMAVVAAINAAMGEDIDALPGLNSLDLNCEGVSVQAVVSGSISASGGTFEFDCRGCGKNFHSYVRPELPCTITCTHNSCGRQFKVNGQRMLEAAGVTVARAANTTGSDLPTSPAPGRPNAKTHSSATRPPSYRKFREMQKLALNAIAEGDEKAMSAALLAIAAHDPADSSEDEQQEN